MPRVLGAADAAWLVAGNMIGAGIFVTPGLVAGSLPGASWPLVAWGAGGILALCGAAAYGELGARLPRAGGDYQYLTTAFGPMWGFVTGWSSFVVTFSGAAAVMSIVVVDHLQSVLPALATGPLRVALPPLVILLLTICNVAGARVARSTTVLFTGAPIAALAVIFAVGLWRTPDAIRLPAADPELSVGVTAIGVAMLPVFFTYTGWNVAAYVAGEVRDAGRNLPRGLLWGTLAVTLLYMLLNALFLVVLPPATLAGSTTAGSQAASILVGPAAERLMAVVIAVAVLGSANVTLMAGARVYYAMARDGLLPRALGGTNAAGAPSAALWVGGAWTALLATTGRTEQLLNWATLAILLLSSMAVAALFVLRRRHTADPGYRCWGYPFTPALFIVSCLGVAVASAVHDWRAAVYGILLVAAAFPVYGLSQRATAKRGVGGRSADSGH